MEDNSHAGQGPVVLDIGGDIGALILAVPAALVGVEIEARPVAGAAKATFDAAAAAPADFVRFAGAEDAHAASDHSHADHHHHSPTHSHSHGPALVHVAVLGRPTDGGMAYSAVFGELQDGDYELYVRPDGPVRLRCTVRGGEVTTQTWPDLPA
ncbi:MAG: hypothetical protein M3Y42_03245 [Actinomycetota bacterium]|nr:hypothetical protein [Actinomycetota bacterium]MDQ2955964.1 hypothetical protein [Actinomycetota bacterium]